MEGMVGGAAGGEGWEEAAVGEVMRNGAGGTGRRSGAAVDGRHVRCTVSEELCAAADAMRMVARGGPMQEGSRAGCGKR